MLIFFSDVYGNVLAVGLDVGIQSVPCSAASFRCPGPGCQTALKLYVCPEQTILPLVLVSCPFSFCGWQRVVQRSGLVPASFAAHVAGGGAAAVAGAMQVDAG